MKPCKKTLELVLKEVLSDIISDEVVVGVSNRHLHISQNDLEKIFGPDYKLTKMKELRQPGHYAANETVTIIGPKGKMDKIRILGPVRKETQVEISMSDAFKLGIKAPVKESGKLEGTPGLTIVGPKGTLKTDKGVIVAGRHIHMPKFIADIKGYKDGDMVSVETSGERKALFHNVLIRVGSNVVKEIHLDMDEANASGASNGDFVKIIRD
ncbi:phosphate propanoyltransferase [Ilyobacter polytropus]|uniref:Phosphate propanoyltransferase n=1 Tax=Ilyobacter polytropus (strain ATCC 51220 / DSM 2926 / LMG 16218 / CuHBu1) TaxID=572544 RepID=E3HDB4_ILYPC|nr:phosphate propanoyltransferase [Ilyobacter polytropus]ADO84114.1 Propanediol utilization protein [Ilyobacter polytropus DSM 2926]